MMEASVYDKEQFTKFFFARDMDDIKKGEYAAFPWDDLLDKYPDINFLMWYSPNIYSLEPNSVVDQEKFYSAEELTRVN
jgi:hypothetical protein